MPSGHRPPIPPGVARVAISGTLIGLPWAMVWYLQLTGTPITSGDLNTLAADIATNWNTNIAPVCTSDCVLTEVSIVYVPSVGNETVGAAAVSHAGTLVGTTIDNVASCIVVNWLINAYYRGGHPRTYHPGVSTGQISGGAQVTGAAQTAVAAAYSAWMTHINGYTAGGIATTAMGTLSFQSGNAWRGTPLFRPYKGTKVRSLLGTQRRRIKA